MHTNVALNYTEVPQLYHDLCIMFNQYFYFDACKIHERGRQNKTHKWEIKVIKRIKNINGK